MATLKVKSITIQIHMEQIKQLHFVTSLNLPSDLGVIPKKLTKISNINKILNVLQFLQRNNKQVIMSNSVNMIINQALELNPIERADVAERLLFSLDKPDSAIDALWAEEADLRIEQYKKGEIETILASEVFSKYHKV